MCIRDSDNPSLKGVLNKEYGRPGLDKQRLGQIINLVSDIAVSYTHLRAHETVLDLVCRLLLEKKKPHLSRSI